MQDHPPRAGRGLPEVLTSRTVARLAMIFLLLTACPPPGGSGSSQAGPTSSGTAGASSSGGTADCHACAAPQEGPGLCMADSGPPCNCPVANLCVGWCRVDGGVVYPAAPCPGYCVDDGGPSAQFPYFPAAYYAPAAPCGSGCAWIGSDCATRACCSGLGCTVSQPDSGQAACCAPNGAPCSSSEDFCCGSCGYEIGPNGKVSAVGSCQAAF